MVTSVSQQYTCTPLGHLSDLTVHLYASVGHVGELTVHLYSSVGHINDLTVHMYSSFGHFGELTLSTLVLTLSHQLANSAFVLLIWSRQ